LLLLLVQGRVTSFEKGATIYPAQQGVFGGWRENQ